MTQTRNLITGFLGAVERWPLRPALVVGGVSFSYLELSRAASNIARSILERQRTPGSLAALFAYRSPAAYAGVLGILASGRGYVPLNPKFPVERTKRMLALSGADVVVVGDENLDKLALVLTASEDGFTIIAPDSSDRLGLRERFPNHSFVFQDEISRGPDLLPAPDAAADSVAYLLFTSGSTGVPKGVAINHRNVTSYVDYISRRYAVTESDRFSQHFDMTFDLSAHDMFVCWERGASLYCVPDKYLMAPAKFIKDHELTMWFSVPSVIAFMSKMGMLQPGSLPSLRYSLFCGEPLPVAFAESWERAAPQSAIENLYGPTEATIAFTHYHWDSRTSPAAATHSILPIGCPFDGQRVCVIDENFEPLPTDEVGELCLSGSQVAAGYWNDPQKTAEQFIPLHGSNGTAWYRTGDLVRQDATGCVHYLGRIDQQVKIRGHRVELQEVECVLRRAMGAAQVVALPWPVSDGTASGVVAFVSGTNELDEERVRAECRQYLPDYMVPRKLHRIDQMPLNVNGKIARSALVSLLKELDQ